MRRSSPRRSARTADPSHASSRRRSTRPPQRAATARTYRQCPPYRRETPPCFVTPAMRSQWLTDRTFADTRTASHQAPATDFRHPNEACGASCPEAAMSEHRHTVSLLAKWFTLAGLCSGLIAPYAPAVYPRRSRPVRRTKPTRTRRFARPRCGGRSRRGHDASHAVRTPLPERRSRDLGGASRAKRGGGGHPEVRSRGAAFRRPVLSCRAMPAGPTPS